MYKSFITKIFSTDIANISAENDDRKPRAANIAWPSECSANVGPYTVGECQRVLFYKILGIKPTDEMSVRGAYICDAGLMFEKFHIERFKSMNMLKDEQVRITFETDTPNKVVVTGKVDCIISHEDKKSAIEIKSVSAFKAPEIFGHSGKLPLPAANNLMQAMLYKHWTKNTEQGKKADIEDVYLMYINRSDGSSFYYKVDLDDQGYPIITAINQAGKELYTMNIQEHKSYEQLLAGEGEANTDQSRVAELRISTKDIFDKFNKVYDNTKNKMLPKTDYKRVYSEADLEQALKCGKITKRKLATLKKSGETYSDYKCTVCSYMKRCLGDSGINLITF